MVQLLADPTFSPNGTPVYETTDGPLVRRPSLGRTDSKVISREEHAQRMRELNAKRGVMRAPRRGWSLTDYQAEDSSQTFHASSHLDHHAAIPENGPLPATPEVPVPEEPISQDKMQLPRRPKLPPPRRSYSVMDYEPFPAGQPKPPRDSTILDLPSELHYAIFDFLDPIDSVCLGLTNSELYDIHRRMKGTVPLSSRYSGPNDREWAWRGAGPLLHSHESSEVHRSRKEEMRVKGQVYCRKCGIHRCELHRHLKEWMGDGYEYCSIKDVFCPLPGEDAKSYCYMKSPKNPHKCGRHGGKQTNATN